MEEVRLSSYVFLQKLGASGQRVLLDELDFKVETSLWLHEGRNHVLR